MHTCVKRLGMFQAFAFCLSAATLVSGCSAPPATLDLITFARKALASAQQTQAEQHAEILGHLVSQTAALDAGFDADVKLAAAGQIKNASGEPLKLTAEWVISARKGYVAARDMLAQQVRSLESTDTVAADNLRAADEALEMAAELILRQYALSERIRQELLQAQRSLVHGR